MSFFELKVLERDLFDVDNPIMGLFVAEIEGALVGYGHWTYTYTIRRGKSMILQDLYVQDKFRNRKVGEKLMQAIAKVSFFLSYCYLTFVERGWCDLFYIIATPVILSPRPGKLFSFSFFFLFTESRRAERDKNRVHSNRLESGEKLLPSKGRSWRHGRGQFSFLQVRRGSD